MKACLASRQQIGCLTPTHSRIQERTRTAQSPPCCSPSPAHRCAPPSPRSTIWPRYAPFFTASGSIDNGRPDADRSAAAASAARLRLTAGVCTWCGWMLQHCHIWHSLQAPCTKRALRRAAFQGGSKKARSGRTGRTRELRRGGLQQPRRAVRVGAQQLLVAAPRRRDHFSGGCVLAAEPAVVRGGGRRREAAYVGCMVVRAACGKQSDISCCSTHSCL